MKMKDLAVMTAVAAAFGIDPPKVKIKTRRSYRRVGSYGAAQLRAERKKRNKVAKNSRRINRLRDAA